MNTRRNATRRLEKDIDNAGVPPRGDQVPPLEEDANDEQAPIRPPSLMNGDIRAALFQMPKPLLFNHKSSLPNMIGRLYLETTNMLVPWPPV